MKSLLIAAFLFLQPAQADSIILSNQVVISSDLPNTPHAEPHLSINPNNPDDLLLGAIVLPDSTKHRVNAFRSLDGGNSWRRKHLPIADSLSSIDPWTDFDLKGNAYLSVLAPTTFYPNDKDMGFIIFRNRPNQPRWINTYTHVIEKGDSFDQPKIVVDQSKNSEYTNRLYVSSTKWGVDTKQGNSTHTTGLLYSEGTSESFSEARHIAENNVKNSTLNPVILSDGTLVGGFFNYLLLDSRRFQQLAWTFKSTDGGKTTTYPNLVTSKLALSRPNITADTTSNGFKDRIYVTGTVTKPDTMLATFYSDSKGDRWSSANKVDPITSGNARITSYSGVDGKGRLGIIWTQKIRQNKNKECFKVSFSYSTDGGNSFATKTLANKYCVTIPGKPKMFTMAEEYRPVNPRFANGGEYLGLVGLTQGGFYVVWVQTVEGTLQLKGSKISFE